MTSTATEGEADTGRGGPDPAHRHRPHTTPYHDPDYEHPPCDPVFWMHHTETDRIWWEWRATHPGQNPPLAGAAATIDPWSETEPDTRDINTLGFTSV